MDKAFDEAEKSLTASESPSEPVKDTPQPPAEAAAPESPSEEPSPSQPAADPIKDWVEKNGSPELKNLVTKYGGDLNKAAAEYWAVNNRLAEQAKSQPQAVESTSAPAPTEAAPVPEEIASLDRSLQELADQRTALQERHQKYASEYSKVQDAIRVVNRRLARETDFETEQSLRKKLTELVDVEDAYVKAFDQIAAQNERLDNKYELTALKRDRVWTQVQQEAYSREAAYKAKVEDTTNFVDSFRAALNVVVSEPDLPPDLKDDFVKEVTKYVKSESADVIDGWKFSDLPSIIRAQKQDFLKFVERSHKVRSAEYSKLKNKDVSVNAPEGQAAVAPATKKRGFSSSEEFMAHWNAAD